MRKRMFVFTVVIMLFLQQFAAVAYGIPNEFWKMSENYTKALNSKNSKDIIKYGKDIENLYIKEPMNKEKAEILNPRCKAISNAYLELGDYDNAVIYLNKHIEYSKFLKETDNVMNAEALINHLNLMVDVYAATKNTNDLPYYGSKYEPKIGTYFGRIESLDYKARLDESAVLVYVEFFNENIADFCYKIDTQSDSGRVIELAWNMPNENDDLKKILETTSDNYIESNLKYLATIKSPILLRIGAEMNCWTNLAQPQLYKDAYVKIAKMARKLAPNVALVFSPNYVSARTVTMQDYYPGDEWVDWVGVSLYSNKYSGNNVATKTPQPVYAQAFYGIGDYANPVALLKELIEAFGDKKPIMISEFGSGHTIKATNEDLTQYAKTNINILYRYINMVYPQVKCIMYFDNEANIESSKYIYAIEKNSIIKAAYDDAIKKNSTLIKNYGDETYGYTKLSNYSDKTNKLDLSTYIVLPEYKNVTCEYYVDGVLYKTSNTLPYDVSIDLASLSIGSHRIKVIVKSEDNYKKIKEYNLFKGSGDVVTCTAYTENAKNITATPTAAKVLVDGKDKAFEAYSINGSNYFKLRDIAYVLNDSSKKFEIGYDNVKNAITITTGIKYTANGAEMKSSNNKKSINCYSTNSDIYLNGQKISLTAYNIGGSNYFKLRDIGMIIDFNVLWNSSAQSIEVLTNSAYQPE